jgi:F0F1-type ATP synthase alpha subunit
LKLRPEEITSILKSRIEHYDVQTDLSEVGTVLELHNEVRLLDVFDPDGNRIQLVQELTTA